MQSLEVAMYFKHSVKRLSQAGQNSVEESFLNFPERIKLAIEQAGEHRSWQKKLVCLNWYYKAGNQENRAISTGFD